MRLSLGLDLSTQSISAVVLDIDNRRVVHEHSLDYCRDSRLNRFGIRPEDYILPPRNEGEASQPVAMYFAALDAMFADLKSGIDLSQVVAVNTSGQQHGHVYLNANAPAVFGRLKNEESVRANLGDILNDSLAWERAPIWLTSDTSGQAEFIRKRIGGKERLIGLSGADAPLRFTGVVIRKSGQEMPEVYRNTTVIQLIGNLVAAVLTASPNVPADFGNASGMALMDYRKREWSDELLDAVGEGLPGGKTGLRGRLPEIVPPDSVVGNPAEYFVRKYGFARDCSVFAGSGDNPQSKVLVSGDLLSLGTSIVNMVSTDGDTMDLNGFASAMYDGVGRPFMFGTRTNGVMVWDRLRAMYGMNKKEYAPAEEALESIPVAQNMLFWQPRNESFPPSGIIEFTRVGGFSPRLGADYGALIETTLAAVYHYSKGFTRDTDEPLYVTGGARNSREILRRVAAIWNRPVVPIEAGGAALGAAVAGAVGYLRSKSESVDTDEYTGTGLLKKDEIIRPLPEDAAAFHRKGGFLDRIPKEEAKLIS